MKKLLSILLALLMIFTVVGCSKKDETPAPAEEGEG
jgi:predicted small lipoprotein YifL